MGIPTDSEALGASSITSALTPVSVSLTSTCPADVALPHGAVFSYAPMCQFASGLRPVVLAMAWLAAGLIVLGGKANE
ncbi:virulence factor TspB C-terminal domain-related protein [Georgfuchsia toluolica]|uniref:virulence factor TspB C-terminal domain-related protein n=1 Tax=Georgfuchsia toluolica TaxID=424218 RepID=UPI003CCE9054